MAIQIRTRVGLSRTMKEGWRHETTVEITSDKPMQRDEFEELFAVYHEMADASGRREAIRRNRLDAPVYGSEEHP